MSDAEKPAADPEPQGLRSASGQAGLLALLMGICLIVTGFSHPLSITIQNGLVGVLFLVAGISHFQKKPWAFGLTMSLIGFVLVITFVLPLLIKGNSAIGVLPSALLLVLGIANGKTLAKPLSVEPGKPQPDFWTGRTTPLTSAQTRRARIGLKVLAAFYLLVGVGILVFSAPVLGSDDPRYQVWNIMAFTGAGIFTVLALVVFWLSFRFRSKV